jgi:hypothetical protein
LPLYASTAPPVLGSSPASAVEAVVSLVDGSHSYDPDVSRTWVRAEHGVEQAVDTVVGVYADVMAARA